MNEWDLGSVMEKKGQGGGERKEWKMHVQTLRKCYVEDRRNKETAIRHAAFISVWNKNIYICIAAMWNQTNGNKKNKQLLQRNLE